MASTATGMAASVVTAAAASPRPSVEMAAPVIEDDGSVVELPTTSQ